MWHRLCWCSPQSSIVPDVSQEAGSTTRSDSSVGSFESNNSFLRDYDESDCHLELSDLALDMAIPRTPISRSGGGQPPAQAAVGPNTRRNPPTEYHSLGTSERIINVVGGTEETGVSTGPSDPATAAITQVMEDVTLNGGSTQDHEERLSHLDDLSHLGAVGGGVFSVQGSSIQLDSSRTGNLARNSSRVGQPQPVPAPRVSSLTSSVSVPGSHVDAPHPVNSTVDQNQTPPWANDLAGNALQRIISYYKSNADIGQFHLKSDLRTLERIDPQAYLLEPFSACYDQILERVESQRWFERYEEKFHSIAEPWFDLAWLNRLNQAEVNTNRHPAPTVADDDEAGPFLINDVDPEIVPTDGQLQQMVTAAASMTPINDRQPKVTAAVQPWMAPQQNSLQGLGSSSTSVITRGDSARSSASAALSVGRNGTFTVREGAQHTNVGGSTEEQRQFLQSLVDGSWQRRYSNRAQNQGTGPRTNQTNSTSGQNSVHASSSGQGGPRNQHADATQQHNRENTSGGTTVFARAPRATVNSAVTSLATGSGTERALPVTVSSTVQQQAGTTRSVPPAEGRPQYQLSESVSSRRTADIYERAPGATVNTAVPTITAGNRTAWAPFGATVSSVANATVPTITSGNGTERAPFGVTVSSVVPPQDQYGLPTSRGSFHSVQLGRQDNTPFIAGYNPPAQGPSVSLYQNRSAMANTTQATVGIRGAQIGHPASTLGHLGGVNPTGGVTQQASTTGNYRQLGGATAHPASTVSNYHQLGGATAYPASTVGNYHQLGGATTQPVSSLAPPTVIHHQEREAHLPQGGGPLPAAPRGPPPPYQTNELGLPPVMSSFGAAPGFLPTATPAVPGASPINPWDHKILYQSYPWPRGWEFDTANMTQMSLKEVRELKVTYDGDYTQYSSFRDHVYHNIHLNGELTVSLKSSLLAQSLGKEPKLLCGAKTTPKLSEFAGMLKKLDEFFNRDKIVAFREALKSIGVFDTSKPDASVLCRLIGLLNTCESLFGNEDVSVVIRYILQKLGGLENNFISINPNEATWSLRKLNNFITPYYNHYRCQTKPPPNVRNRQIAREPLPKKDGFYNEPEVTAQIDESPLDAYPDFAVVSESSTVDHNQFMSAEEQHYTLLEKAGRFLQPAFKEGWPPCVACGAKHLLVYCPKWWNESLNYEQRKNIAIEHKRCFRCLSPAHSASKCPRHERCGVCLSDNHHTRLHNFSKDDPKNDGFVTTSKTTYSRAGENMACRMQKKIDLCTISFSVVYLKNPVNGEKVKVCCIRDNCCSESVCCMSIARKLDCSGKKRTRTTNGVGGCAWTAEVMTAMATIESLDGRHSSTFPLSFAEKPCGNLKFVDWRSYLDSHPSLLPIKKLLPSLGPEDDDSVLMILGTDHPDLILRPDDSLNEAEGVPSWLGGEGFCKPFALRTVLGWSVCGFTGAQAPNAVEIVRGNVVLSHLSVAYVGQGLERAQRATVEPPDQETHLGRLRSERAFEVTVSSSDQNTYNSDISQSASSHSNTFVGQESKLTFQIAVKSPDQANQPDQKDPARTHRVTVGIQNQIDSTSTCQEPVRTQRVTVGLPDKTHAPPARQESSLTTPSTSQEPARTLRVTIGLPDKEDITPPNGRKPEISPERKALPVSSEEGTCVGRSKLGPLP